MRKKRIAEKKAALEQPEAKRLIQTAQKQLKAIWVSANLSSVDDVVVKDAIKSILGELVHQHNHLPYIYRHPHLKAMQIEGQRNIAQGAPDALLEAYAETMVQLHDLVIRAHNGD